MSSELSLSARREITKKEARAYASAGKKAKGQVLDRLMAEVGWSRANARRQLAAATARCGPARAVTRRPRPRTYTYDTLKVLQRVWQVTGRPCGKYLAPIMAATLANMQAHTATGSFGQSATRYSPQVREQLLRMSPATIDRLLAPYKRGLHPGGKSTTRSRKNRHAEAIPIMTHVAAIDWQPGLVAIDTVAHCGHTTRGQYAFTLTVTDVFTGWTINKAIRNKAAVWVAEAMDEINTDFPYPIDHVHSDNGSEFLNDPVTKWANQHDIRMTRSRPQHSNDNPFVEQKNGAIVRKSAFGYRYDTEDELDLLNKLWVLVNLRKNLFLPTTKVTGWRVTRSGRTVRTYDKPRTPADRILDTGILLPPERNRLTALHASVDLAEITEQITQIQHRLIILAEAATYAQAPHAA
ncbi:MAG: transposase family protein [Terrimesophilobacter sp.]